MTESVLADRSPDPAREAQNLRAALEHANIPTLLMVLVHLTGDDRWLAEPYCPKRGKPLDDNDTAGLSDELQATIRRAAFDAIISHWRGERTPVELTPDRIAEMLEIAVCEEVPRSYGPLLAEEMGLATRDVAVPSVPAGQDFNVLVIGSGLSGLCAAIKLKEAGIEYTVIEKNGDVGGTWLENAYPGCGVDTPSHFYSFSFAPNTAWSRYFAKRDEVHAYISWLADDYDLHGDIRFNTEVVQAAYDESNAVWRVRIRHQDGSEETLAANVLISAVGMVNRPSIPPIEGLDDFTGPVMHSAQWRSDVNLAGKRVAVIGNGASANQIVPAIVDRTEHLLIFQRSKQWALPNPNYQRQVSDDTRYLMEKVPLYLSWYRLRTFWSFGDRVHPSLQVDESWPHPDRSINAVNERHRVFLTDYIKSELGDRTDLVDSCVPDYPPYGKRPLIDNGWFRTVRRDDVELISDAVAAASADTVVTASGKEYNADVIVLATGFKTLQFLWPMDIVGRSGRTLREQWGEDDARAYLGVTVPDFPNFFILNGPNTFAGHGGSAIISTEFQVRYTMQAIKHLIEAELASTEVREDTFWTYNKELDEALSRTIWAHPGMTNYFRNDAGRVVVTCPWTNLDYRERTRAFDPADYHDESAKAV